METRVSSVKVEKYRPLESVKLPDIKVSQEEIKKLQTGDESLRRCREVANQETDEKRQSGKIEFVLRNDLIYKYDKGISTEEDKLRLVIPEAMKKRVLEMTHCQSLTIHNNARDTLNKTTSEFYWEGMRSDVSQFVESCDTCQRIVSKIAMSRAQMNKKGHSNKKSRNRKLEIGDKALLLLPNSNNKLLMQWQGPFNCKRKSRRT